jgi:4-aminobutyrate aminotransferase-like enzyme
MKDSDLIRRYAQKTVADIGAPVFFKTAQGCRIETRDGRQIIDFIAGFGVVNTGWQHPGILDAVEKQLHKGAFAHA